jgi:hypothetical protein
MNNSFAILITGGAILLGGSPETRAAVSIQIVADNDFAVYAGTGSSITRSIYQNEVIWNSQLAAASTFSFDLEPGETTFYLLAMGGSGEENISGKINGVNIVKIFQDDPTAVIQSNAIQAFLSSYDTGAVSNGTYSPTLGSVQAALGQTTWGAPQVVGSATVINSNPESFINGLPFGFNVPSSQAVFFRFNADSVGVPTVPEPSTTLMVGVMAVLSCLRRRPR